MFVLMKLWYLWHYFWGVNSFSNILFGWNCFFWEIKSFTRLINYFRGLLNGKINYFYWYTSMMYLSCYIVDWDFWKDWLEPHTLQTQVRCWNPQLTTGWTESYTHCHLMYDTMGINKSIWRISSQLISGCNLDVASSSFFIVK